MEESLTAADYLPLTNDERWSRYWRDTLLSPSLYFAATAAAIGAQIHNSPPEWHQGVAGYSRRVVSELGVIAIQKTIAQGGAAVLGYEPRYLHCECRGFFRRSGHAVLWSFLTKNTAGATRFDIPSVAGAYGGGMISMLWYPARYEPLSDGVRIGNQQTGINVGLNVIREFTPEFRSLFHLQH